MGNAKRGRPKGSGSWNRKREPEGERSWEAALESHNTIVAINREAKKRGMTYGTYVASEGMK